jgi:hypothetical protein
MSGRSTRANGKRAATSANGAKAAAAAPSLASLPDAALIQIWRHLPVTHSDKVENRHAVPQVCRRWRRLARSPEAQAALWTELEVSLPAAPALRKFPTAGLYRWLLSHGAAVRSLTLEISGVEGWTPAHALLGALGPRLTSLRVYSDNDDAPAYEPRSRAPWLALAPRLQSLALEGVVDTTIERASLPAGLTHLALDGCGQAGLHRVPEVLAALPALRSLSLQFMEPGADLSELASLGGLQRLDLSSCQLPEVPREVTLLTALTALTLNNNEELGGEGNGGRCAALGRLPSLEVLEMRDCGLKAVPEAVTGLRSLRTLLLGYNDLTAPTVIPPGPYLESLELLAMSDSMPEPRSVVDVVVKPLAGATNLQVLRINRNWGLALSTPVAAALLKGKPRFRKLEYSEDMGADLDVAKLNKIFPGVTFKVVE